MSADPRKKYNISVCAIFKNESRSILEWIAYHKTIGVQHFYLYDNDSTDETGLIVERLVKTGICTLTDWPRASHPDNPQVLAYRDAIARFGSANEWIAFIDIDEFIVSLKSNNIFSALNAHFGHASSVLINWRMFGSNGNLKDDGRPVIERFRFRAVDSYHAHRNVKAIVRPSRVDTMFIHNHHMIDDLIVDSSGRKIDDQKSQLMDNPVYDHFQINHYYCKSYDEFLLKRAKGRAGVSSDHSDPIRPLSLFTDADRNEVRDDTIAVDLPRVRKEMGDLSEMMGSHV